MLRVSLCVRAPCSVCRLTVCLFGARCWGTAAVLRDVARCSAGVLRGLCGCHLRVFCGCSAGVLRGLFGCSAGALWAPFAGVLRVFCGCSEGALRLPFAGVLWEGLDLPDAEAPLQGPSISHDNGRVNVARAEHGAVVTNSGDSDGDGDSGSDSGSDDDGWDSGGDDSDMRQRGPVIAEATAVVVSSRTDRRKGSGGGVGGGGKRQRVAPGNVNDRGRPTWAPRPNAALREQTESGEEKVARNAKLALGCKRYRCRNCKPRNPCVNHLV